MPPRSISTKRVVNRFVNRLVNKRSPAIHIPCVLLGENDASAFQVTAELRPFAGGSADKGKAHRKKFHLHK
jgi:hypothetical protein